MGLLYNVKQGQPYASPVQVLADTGTITIQSGLVILTKATASTITLPDPPVANNGAMLIVVSHTAAAHKLDNSGGSGFNGGGATLDVGTFGGAAQDGIVLYAYNGNWHVVPGTNLNVTIGAT